jgi:hypothetical protein
MYIEVTKKTFDLIFVPLMFQKTENSELANKFNYWNSETDQRGIVIHNFTKSVTQYHLLDINA